MKKQFMLSGLHWRRKRNGKADCIHIFQVIYDLFPFMVQSYNYTSTRFLLLEETLYAAIDVLLYRGYAMIIEGQEKDDFWSLLGGKGTYSSDPVLRVRTRHTVYFAPVYQLGPLYFKRQHQCCDNSGMTLGILFSLTTMECLKNRLQSHSGATPLFSMRTVSLTSSLMLRQLCDDARDTVLIDNNGVSQK